VELADRAAISGPVAEHFVELPERHGAALHVAIRPGRFEKLHQIVARDRGIAADVLQHPLIGELDQRIAEVEEEPGDGHRIAKRYILNTPKRGSAIAAL